ncbi:MAG: hypothetical protein JW914_07590 [Syntrophaceae bacterium]|nr:hypothetical protein [Syntrophaceae bacterium]
MTIKRLINNHLNIYFLLFIIFYPAIFYFRTNNIEEVTRIIIPLFVFIIFIFVSLTISTGEQHNIILYFVFLFILTGDCIINWSQHIKFSIIPFSLAHILLGIYYIFDIRFKRKDFLFFIPVLIFSALLFFMARGEIKGALLQSAFIIYLTILNFMLWRALCYLRSKQNSLKILLVIVGSLFFYMTDIFVSLYAIYDNKIFITLIWIIYPPALFFLSLINVGQSKINFFEVKK